MLRIVRCIKKYNRRNFTKVLFLDYLLSKSTNESISTIYIDKFRMFVELGLCNESYKKRYSDIIYNRVEVDHMTILEKEHFKTTYNSSYDLLKNIMDKLNEDTHIIKSYVYLISYQDDEKQKEASTKLHLKINEIKLDLCKNEEFIYTNDKGTKLSPSNPNMLVGDPYKYRLFMKMLNKILKKKYGIIKCNYVIKVTTSNTLIKLALDDSIKNIKRKNNKMTLEHIIQRIKIAAKKDVIYGEALIPVRVTIANKYNKI